MRNFSRKTRKENQKTELVFNSVFLKIVSFMRKCGKIFLDSDRLKMTIWRMCIAGWIPKATNTYTIRNTYCFSTATMVKRTRLNATFTHTLCMSCCSKHTKMDNVQKV